MKHKEWEGVTHDDAAGDMPDFNNDDICAVGFDRGGWYDHTDCNNDNASWARDF